MLHRAMLSLGSNAGDRSRLLETARQNIAEAVGPIRLASREYRTEPWGNFADTRPVEPFLNQVLVVETLQSPLELLDTLQQIEHRLGRPVHTPEYTPGGQRIYRSRPIDLDILFYDSLVLDTPRLTIPHPQLARRRFVLEPAAEICPEFRHPVLKISLQELLNSIL
ncbi:2-amino-4-hydroxy-6-hydroxymethyldihydropteridine diphosphokinase [uncultured Rikenella sp.]|uniref:2-amino-4-hydroxy-6- hydroxymethyldihydropteridine diphosphokinase n=1 Tax=uncultured Rikenella sp. TaxID=368003 RepID=UPI0025F4F58B|nr:2-amino-4-hydroxy-6-hydroxymethyldihydropteridine diphosphokinase [uncultured Rikenella sp.]